MINISYFFMKEVRYNVNYSVSIADGYWNQGCCASGKPVKPGKIREFDFALENLEKSGNFTPLSGKTIFFSKINFVVYFGQWNLIFSLRVWF